jgi:hypothetical protein
VVIIHSMTADDKYSVDGWRFDTLRLAARGCLGTGEHTGGEDMESEKEPQLESGWAGPGIEVWPDDDSDWLMRHRNVDRALDCSIPAVAASPFCGQGYHNG